MAQEVKDGSHSEMEKLGIVVDALQIQEIEDATGYILMGNYVSEVGNGLTGLAGIPGRQGSTLAGGRLLAWRQ